MSMTELKGFFGKPRGYSGEDAWSEIESGAGTLSQEYKELVSAYGPGVVGGLLNVFHPDQDECSMLDFMRAMAPLYQEIVPDSIPYGVYPAVAPGMVQWASTSDGDACFLVPGRPGEWRIGVWFRQWSQWEEFDMAVTEWLAHQLAGRLRVDGLPLAEVGGFRPTD
jgi:hypothetical protein